MEKETNKSENQIEEMVYTEKEVSEYTNEEEYMDWLCEASDAFFAMSLEMEG